MNASRAILAVFAVLFATVVGTALLPEPAALAGSLAADGPEVPPEVIRFGGPGSYKVNQKMWGLLEVAREKGFLEREFARTGTRIEYVGFTTVPMVGEALASGAIEFAGQGELIAMLSRSTGNKTRMILPISKMENAYLVVPNGSSIRRVEDIRGKRIAYVRGAYIHIQTLRILADHGLSERDIHPVNLDPASAATVIAANGIDGVFLGAQAALPMRNRGIARIVYDTKQAAGETAQTGLIVTDAFARRYPQTTQHVVNALVRAARWAANPANRDELTRLWVYGTDRSIEEMREDLGTGSLTGRTSPLIDTFVLSQYRNTQSFAISAKLLRNPVDLDRWIDPSFVNRAIRAQQLEGFWPDFDPQGRPVGHDPGVSLPKAGA